MANGLRLQPFTTFSPVTDRTLGGTLGSVLGGIAGTLAGRATEAILGRSGTVPVEQGPVYNFGNYPIARVTSIARLRGKRMNVCNMKALTRSIRRIKGFEKKARRVLSITNPGKKVRMKIRKTRGRKC